MIFFFHVIYYYRFSGIIFRNNPNDFLQAAFSRTLRAYNNQSKALFPGKIFYIRSYVFISVSDVLIYASDMFIYIGLGKSNFGFFHVFQSDFFPNPIYDIRSYLIRYTTVSDHSGESAALRRRMPWVSRLFSKSMGGKILNFFMKLKK